LFFDKVPVAIHLVPMRFSWIISTEEAAALPKTDSVVKNWITISPEK
jgi:hypothetical protein